MFELAEKYELGEEVTLLMVSNDKKDAKVVNQPGLGKCFQYLKSDRNCNNFKEIAMEHHIKEVLPKGE